MLTSHGGQAIHRERFGARRRKRPETEAGLRPRPSTLPAAGCASCHRFDNDGAAVGPDLTNLAGRFSLRDLLESLVEPSKEISDQYGAVIIRKKEGDSVVGRVGNLNGDNLMVLENMFAPKDFTGVKRDQIESIELSKVSMMPEGLLSDFKEDEIPDLIAFPLSCGDGKAKMLTAK
jgi:putative heme-binding domain-containing protein